MSESSLGDGFLAPLGKLTYAEIDEALEAAFSNAVDLLEEADVLRSRNRCARAYFLAHIACEELGKLPILAYVATSMRLGFSVDWSRIDRRLRSHRVKTQQVLFMDSIVGTEGMQAGIEAYEEDVRRLPFYNDMKNASLYSFNLDRRFLIPNNEIPCDFYDRFRSLAGGRMDAFDAMYIRPIRERGGIEGFLSGPVFERKDEIFAQLLGEESRAAFERFQQTGDESSVAEFFDRLLTSLLESVSNRGT